MISFKRIEKSDDPLYEYGEKLISQSFPLNEYRDLSVQRDYTDNNDLFYPHIILYKNKPIGIINYWLFPECCYIEHLAIDPEKRNLGYGEKVLTLLRESIKKTIVLEVELPNNDFARRRISFYERAGFKLYNKEYTQPPYRENEDYFPLRIMAYGKNINDEDFENIKSIIHKEVYGII